MAAVLIQGVIFSVSIVISGLLSLHHVIWGMKWAKWLKTKNGQNMSSGPFSHDTAQLLLKSTNRSKTFLKHRENDPSEIKTYTSL